MQISHQHNLINCSQYGDYCRIDSFGDIPGQVDSLFWGLRILWTIKSALGLVSGLSLLIVKKFPCGEQMVREANGQNKLRFSQVFWTLILVVTLSHNFSKCGKHIATLRRLIEDVELFIYCQILYIFLSQLILCSFTWRLQYAWFLFRGGGDRHLFQLSQQLASVRNYFIFFSIIAVVHLFSQAGDFPGCGDFPSVFRCQRSSSFLFQSSKQADFNARFSTVRKNNFIFSVPYFFSHSQQVHEPAYKQSTIPNSRLSKILCPDQ